MAFDHFAITDYLLTYLFHGKIMPSSNRDMSLRLP